MKKVLLMSFLACLVAAPAMANDPAKLDEKFTKMDKNADGVITQDEHATAKDHKFEETDTDGDGQITKEELKTSWEKKKSDHKS